MTLELPERESKAQAVPKKISKIVKHKQKQHEANLKRLAKEKDHERQLEEWNNPTLFAKQEREFMKDPFRTVFIARLDYNLTELDISRAFARYGMIESIRIIRDKQGKSRGYGFVVYERNTDAMNCVNDLSRTGLKLGNRPILVDIERSRVLKNWRPRRLGGGEGGRGYVKEGKYNLLLLQQEELSLLIIHLLTLHHHSMINNNFNIIITSNSNSNSNINLNFKLNTILIQTPICHNYHNVTLLDLELHWM